MGITIQVTLSNLIQNGSFETDSSWSGVTFDTTEAKWGSRSQKFATGGTYVGSCPMQSPVVGHIYYGRHYIKTAGNASPSDCRFEWYAGDGAGLNFVFGWNRGDHADWHMESNRIQVTAVNGSSYICRSFVVNTDFTVWADGLMIVDLTEAFGIGCEPSKEWCDENIPFFDGSATINYEIEMIVDRTQEDVGNGTDKGFYNSTDLNRVEGAVNYLCGLLQSTPEDLQDHAELLGVEWETLFDVPYDPGDYSLTVKTNWTMADLPTVTDLARYLGNVKTLVGAVPPRITQLEYIESTGTQYIDTGFKPSGDNMRVVLDFMCTHFIDTGGAFFYGVYNSSKDLCQIELLQDSTENVIYSYIGNSSKFRVYRGQVEGVRLTADAKADSGTYLFSVSGQTTSGKYSGEFEKSCSLALFCENTPENEEPSDYSWMRLFSCQIYDGDTLVRDYVPCKTRSGEIGLYDRVNDQFYGNAGSGTFISGPALPNLPALPETMASLTYTGANAIEEAIVTLYDALMAEADRITGLLDNTAAAWCYSGEFYAGEI